MLFAHTPVLSSFQFVDMPEDHPPPFGFYLAKLVKHTWWTYFVSFALVVAFQSTPHRIRKFTPKFYVSCLWAHLYNAITTIAVRRIFLKETVAGQKRAQIYQNRTRWQAFVYFWKVYVLTSPKLLAVIFAGIFVQVAEKHQVVGAWDFVAYSLGTLALKAAIKELAKKGVVKLNVKDVRSIFVTAGLPTVLIDTQLRVMLQRMQSTSYTLVWIFGMIAIEIAIRVSKVYYTRRQVLRREAALSPTGAITPQIVRKSFLRLGERTDLINFEQWKRQILSFQIAESYASMTAEYIAIGCSTSIVFFYWNHPKYELSRLRGSSVTNDSSSSSSTRFEVPWGQAPALVLQIVVELCVDYFACVLETGSGIEFHLIQRHRRFLALLFMSITTLNILISAVLYIPVK
uniref:Uncharacterized protein n=1 Tax=Globisporangium ultimum (strain ATCC 200006 / CBS 805.95 / DAOM BR144) TaxID=431595 RepID=K3WFQ8_GLOUD